MPLGAWIELGVVLLLLIYACIGLKRGFVKSFFSAFGTIFAFLLAVLLASKVTVFLEDKFGAVTSISSKLAGLLSNKFGAELMDVPIKDATENALNGAGIDKWIISLILSAKSDTSISGTTTINQVLSPAIGYYIILILSVIGLFIVFKIIFFLIGEIVKKLYKIKMIALLDRLLGFIVGLVSGTITLEFIIMITGIIPIGFIQNFNVLLIKSVVAGTIHNINLFGLIMQWVGSQDLFAVVKKVITKA